MRVILSTVLDASVTIEGRTVGQICCGYLLLVGFTDGDDKEIVSKMVDKILSLRVFPDEHGMINISIYIICRCCQRQTPFVRLCIKTR